MKNRKELIIAVLIIVSLFLLVGMLDKKEQEKEREMPISQEQSKEYVAYQMPISIEKETVKNTVPEIKGLKIYYPIFLSASQKYNVDVKLLISISALESGWGTSYYVKANNNIFGWCSGEMKFNSVDECINYVAEFISREYLNPQGMYYEGTSIDDIAKHYNENPQRWAEEAKEIYESLGGN